MATQKLADLDQETFSRGQQTPEAPCSIQMAEIETWPIIKAANIKGE
jgi:hypothetical protein